MSHEPRVTIAFVPRETFSQTQRALETMYASTTGPFELVCIDGGSPRPIKKYLEDAARDKGFTLIRTEAYLAPNQARNLALEHVKTEFVAFVDNDSLVAPGWLDALLRCADETGAWVVGPLYIERALEGERIHMSGGICRIAELPDGGRSYFERHHNQFVPHAQATGLDRQETELVEFHAVLARMAAFEKIGPLDPELTCMFEHGDFCLSVRRAGGSVFFEPAASVTYVLPQQLEAADRKYFLLRWNEGWLEGTIRRLTEKYGLSKTDPEMDIARAFVRSQRCLRMTWLDRLPRMVGDKAAHAIRHRLVEPLEIIYSRCRFAFASNGTAKPVSRVQVSPAHR
jgi:glycosyltransferase involved in cell wall biosynthesis